MRRRRRPPGPRRSRERSLLVRTAAAARGRPRGSCAAPSGRGRPTLGARATRGRTALAAARPPRRAAPACRAARLAAASGRGPALPVVDAVADRAGRATALPASTTHRARLGQRQRRARRPPRARRSARPASRRAGTRRRRPGRRAASASSAVAAGAQLMRARCTSWRSALPESPSSRATSSCAVGRSTAIRQQRLALALRQRGQRRRASGARPRGARARPRRRRRSAATPAARRSRSPTDPQQVQRRVVAIRYSHGRSSRTSSPRCSARPGGHQRLLERVLGARLRQHPPAGAQQRLAVALDDRLEGALVAARASATRRSSDWVRSRTSDGDGIGGPL